MLRYTHTHTYTHFIQQTLVTLCLCLHFLHLSLYDQLLFSGLRSSRSPKIWFLGFYLRLLSRLRTRCVVSCSVCPPSAKMEPCRYTLTFSHTHMTGEHCTTHSKTLTHKSTLHTCWGIYQPFMIMAYFILSYQLPTVDGVHLSLSALLLFLL